MRSLHPAEAARVKGGTAIVPVALVAPAVHEGSSLAPIMVPATIGHVTATFPERFP